MSYASYNLPNVQIRMELSKQNVQSKIGVNQPFPSPDNDLHKI